MSDYVVEGATLKCTNGSVCGKLAIPGPRSSLITGYKKASVIDCIPYINIVADEKYYISKKISPFGLCKTRKDYKWEAKYNNK